MAVMLATPRELVQSFAEFRLPARTDARLQSLIDRNTEGLLQPDERDELESLVELSETLSLLRARALQALGRGPA